VPAPASTLLPPPASSLSTRSLASPSVHTPPFRTNPSSGRDRTVPRSACCPPQFSFRDQHDRGVARGDIGNTSDTSDLSDSGGWLSMGIHVSEVPKMGRLCESSPPFGVMGASDVSRGALQGGSLGGTVDEMGDGSLGGTVVEDSAGPDAGAGVGHGAGDGRSVGTVLLPVPVLERVVVRFPHPAYCKRSRLNHQGQEITTPSALHSGPPSG
jgi:hypothetical protein